jgi:hypothetical protein
MVASADTSISAMNPIQLQDITETIYAGAVARARVAVPPAQPEPSLEQLLQDGSFRQRLKIGLAEGVANILAASDERVLSVHYYEESAPLQRGAERHLPADPTVHLLVLVRVRSAGLDALVTALDRALTDTVRAIQSPLTGRHASLLNPVLITQEDVAQRRGCAVLLSLAYQALLTIWERDGLAD